MRKHGLFLTKEGMTRIWQDDRFVPVTVLRYLDQELISEGPMRGILFVKNTRNRINKPMKGLWQKHNIAVEDNGFYRTVQGVQAPIDLNFFTAGKYVDITGKSKGKGFQGVMKRWNFKGGRASHGNSLTHRGQGSTGMRQDPGKTNRGKKMAGHLGNEQVTQQNLRIVRIVQDENIDKAVLVLVEGSVPGPKKSVLFVREAVKIYGE